MTYYNGSIVEQEWIHCCRNGYFSWSSHLTMTTVLQQNHNLIFRPEEMNIVVWSHIGIHFLAFSQTLSWSKISVFSLHFFS